MSAEEIFTHEIEVCHPFITATAWADDPRLFSSIVAGIPYKGLQYRSSVFGLLSMMPGLSYQEELFLV
ncbi:MAG: hypothetical protein LUQ47_02270 [Methanotrichaceae archaeon]|nr:hypothetical protein [Methanotrichaceae archaeon]